jgi:hypothetical protein
VAAGALFVIPVAFLAGLAVLFFIHRRRGLGSSLLLFVASIGAGLWAIMQSRASTAGIGVIFLPLLGSIAGSLGLASAHLRASPRRGGRLLGWVCLLAAVAVIVSSVVDGARTIERNKRRDAQQAAHAREIDRNRVMIAALLAENKGREPEVLNRLVQERSDDRAFLIPALESPFVSAENLDRLAGSGDLGIALQAVRNPNCPADTLTRVYRTHAYPDYFFQALAGHPHTPPDILRELYRRPRTITNLDYWFARNPATPPDILEPLADSRDVNVIQRLLQNPRLDCALVERIEGNLKGSQRPDDGDSVSRIAELRRTRCR